MDNIILYLLTIIQDQHKQICWLINFICKYIPLKQWDFDDSHSPEYQKFKVDAPPIIIFKSSYRNTNGYNSDDGALYGVSLWVAYYNFLRPHPYNYWKPLNELDEFSNTSNMPAK